MTLKLYHVSQDVNNGYDTYSDFVVACESEEEAMYTYPNENQKWHDGEWYLQCNNGGEVRWDNYSWCLPSQVKVKYLGEAAEGITGVICSSFHAG